MSNQRKAVFLDRDGVLNNVILKDGKPYPPATLQELIIPEDVNIALTMLRSAGFMLIGATNQPDVARGTTTQDAVEAINAELLSKLPLDEIRVCYHDDNDNCACRKPAPGLITQAAAEYDLDLNASFMIGDRWKDIAAGQAAGCKTIWLNRFYAERGPSEPPCFETGALLEAAQWILNNITSPLVGEVDAAGGR